MFYSLSLSLNIYSCPLDPYDLTIVTLPDVLNYLLCWTHIHFILLAMLFSFDVLTSAPRALFVANSARERID